MLQAFESLMHELVTYQKKPTLWHGVEACLYCIRSVARRIDYKEDEIMPKVGALGLSAFLSLLLHRACSIESHVASRCCSRCFATRR